ncbi:hypothetical protein JW823_04160 [bacterium]|nr:hypothetical protein [candidate division CSSED10-310 bacterium]
MHIATDFWTWVAALLTLAILSFLWDDNSFYRAAEHLYIGVANGYSITLIWYNVVVPNMIDPLRGAAHVVSEQGFAAAFFTFNEHNVLNPYHDNNFFIIIPMMVGALYVTRFIPSISWMIRIPIGITMGYYTAISIPASFKASIVRQLEASILSRSDFDSAWVLVYGLLIFVTTVATLIYFFFSAEHKGVLRPISNIGILTVMVGFGASFGLTVMARISLAIGRFIFIFKDWLGMVQ